jgi:hypothetical protein
MLEVLVLAAVVFGAYFLLKAIWDYEMKVAKSK